MKDKQPLQISAILPESKLSEEDQKKLARAITPKEFVNVFKRAEAGLTGAGTSLISALNKILLDSVEEDSADGISLGTFIVLSDNVNKETPVDQNKNSKTKKKKA